jgi:hypothetical protein
MAKFIGTGNLRTGVLLETIDSFQQAIGLKSPSLVHAAQQ